MMREIHLFFKAFISGAWIGALFGLGEGCFLAWRYPIDTGRFFVIKVVILYVAWGIFIGFCVAITGLIFKAFFRRQPPLFHGTNLNWAIFGIIGFSILASFLIVDRDFFYYTLRTSSWFILLGLLVLFLGVSFWLGKVWRGIPRFVRGLGFLVYFSIVFAGILIPREKILAVVSFSTPADLSVERVEAGTDAPNILFIILDALDVDHVSYLGYSRKTTPNLDSLAKDSVIFTEFYTPTSTAPSVTSLFTGLKPETTQYNYVDDIIADKYFLLGELMQSAGYDTSAFAWTYYIDSLFGFGQGIRHFENLSRLDPAGYCFLKRGLWTVYKKYLGVFGKAGIYAGENL